MKFELVKKIFIMSLRPYKKYECLDLVNFLIFYYQNSRHEIVEINFAVCLESEPCVLDLTHGEVRLRRVSWILAHG